MIDYETFARIKHLHEHKGLEPAQIARELGLDLRTGTRWLEEKRFRARLSTAKPSILDSFKDSIVRMLECYPYLLKGLDINRPDLVWCIDITYIRMRRGFIYLVALMDWYSRYVLSWEVSTTLEVDFCITALNKALQSGCPEIFNGDQGSQFTSDAFTKRLLNSEVRISMDGRGRAFDNIFIERLWRSVKSDEVYLKDYEDLWDAASNLEAYFTKYNDRRLHQALGYKTPAEVYHSCRGDSIK